MERKVSALYSEYIIDGIPQGLTPARMLDSCLAGKLADEPEGPFSPVLDETLDPSLKRCEVSPDRIGEYLDGVIEMRKCSRPGPIFFPESYARKKVAECLVEAIWRKGHFRLGNLQLQTDWKLDSSKIGNLAAFYASVSAVSEYVDSLGLRLKGYSFSEGKVNSLAVKPFVSGSSDDDDDSGPEILSDAVPAPSFGTRRAHPATFRPVPSSWIIYIPFDDCDYNLGGSLLARYLKTSGLMAPQIDDPDYFLDCYEVVRELVEDGIILSGATVGAGGLLATLKDMAKDGTGAQVGISELMKGVGEKDAVRLLFAEVPGVVIQIADSDYDYVDAELLLQDVAFFPLGHPDTSSAEVKVSVSDKTGLQSILESIIRSQSSEGED